MKKIDNPYLEELNEMIMLHVHIIGKRINELGAKMMKEKRMPLDLDQLPVLICVFLEENLSQQEVATFVNRDKSSVNRTLSVFQKKGLIEISKHPEDARKTIIKPTTTGIFIAEQVKQMMYEAEAEIFSFLSKKTRKELLETLKDISERISENEC
ncbi:MAG: MarR family transcriptional regulator [Arachidicoccus sp.]|nr:MarR family transcriptional regulator [Arachidicoccus sp.]